MCQMYLQPLNYEATDRGVCEIGSAHFSKLDKQPWLLFKISFGSVISNSVDLYFPLLRLGKFTSGTKENTNQSSLKSF